MCYGKSPDTIYTFKEKLKDSFDIAHENAKGQVNAMYQYLVEQGLIDHVKVMCFDTIALNTDYLKLNKHFNIF